MKIGLAYGDDHLPVEFPEECTTVIKPSSVAGLRDERSALVGALEAPIAALPLRRWIRPSDRVCIAFTDITRATPNDRLIPWLLDYLQEVPRENITLINATGTHRPNTRKELEKLLTPAVVRDYRVLNHEAENQASLMPFGVTSDGTPALINRCFAEADVRIVTGFIEPHFFAGFSGGPKGIMPGMASLQTIISNHNAQNISHPNAAFGITEGNPIWEEMRNIALRLGPSFLLNVTLNEAKQITGIFAGDLIAAHQAGCEFVRLTAMQPVNTTFDVVVTTNAGYPLDQNLYQGVKGMSAGARIVKPGGAIILACECREGIPEGSPMERLMWSVQKPDEILAALAARHRHPQPEQWQAQIQALIQRKADVFLYSLLPDDAVCSMHLLPCHDISKVALERLGQGPRTTLAVLPFGPMTIPYLDNEKCS